MVKLEIEGRMLAMKRTFLAALVASCLALGCFGHSVQPVPRDRQFHDMLAHKTVLIVERGKVYKGRVIEITLPAGVYKPFAESTKESGIFYVAPQLIFFDDEIGTGGVFFKYVEPSVPKFWFLRDNQPWVLATITNLPYRIEANRLLSNSPSPE